MIKFGMKVPEIFAQLVKGYKKVTGRNPEGLDLIRIRQESLRRFQDMNKVVDMQTGKSIDPSKPIMGGTQEIKEVQKRIDSGVAATVEKMLAMEPIDAMKEANLVIGRKGPYKNLTQEDAKKILEDTEDHIFERNIKPKETDMDFDDNDFAEGGRIGFRIGSDSGKDVSGREYGAPSAAAQSVSTSPSRDNGSSGGNNLTDTTTKQVLKDAGKKVVKNVATNKAIEKLGLGGIFGMAPQVAALLGIINLVRNSQTNEENMFADGGRIGFKKGMDRRTFMKIMGGLTTLPIVGKFFKGAEVAAPVTQKVMENFSSKASEAPTYFFDLMTKIKVFGKKSKVGPSDRVDEYSYTGKNGDEYTLTEDITTGDARITKDKIGGRSYEEGSYDVIEDRTVMDYKARKQDVDVETQRPIDESAEYEEYKVDFDQDGTEAGADAIDEVIQKEIIEEAAEEAPSIKKASGGIARMLGE